MTQALEAVLVNNNSESSPSPELQEINALYREALTALESQKQQIEQQIKAIKEEGETLHNRWLETYTKQKNGHSYKYVQKRWVDSGAGRTMIRGQAVPRKMVGEVRSQIARGKRIEMLSQQIEQVQDKIDRLNQAVLLFRNDLRQLITRICYDNPTHRISTARTIRRLPLLPAQRRVSQHSQRALVQVRSASGEMAGRLRYVLKLDGRARGAVERECLETQLLQRGRTNPAIKSKKDGCDPPFLA